jgi:hypothetical protein
MNPRGKVDVAWERHAVEHRLSEVKACLPGYGVANSDTEHVLCRFERDRGPADFLAKLFEGAFLFGLGGVAFGEKLGNSFHV